MNLVLHSQRLQPFSGLNLERAVNSIRNYLLEEQMTQLKLETLYVCDRHGNDGQVISATAGVCRICSHELEARPYASLVELKEVFDALRDWRDHAYPEDVFPKPDLKLARKLLEEGGMTLDSVSVDVMRNALTSVCRMLGMDEDKSVNLPVD